VPQPLAKRTRSSVSNGANHAAFGRSGSDLSIRSGLGRVGSDLSQRSTFSGVSLGSLGSLVPDTGRGSPASRASGRSGKAKSAASEGDKRLFAAAKRGGAKAGNLTAHRKSTGNSPQDREKEIAALLDGMPLDVECEVFSSSPNLGSKQRAHTRAPTAQLKKTHSGLDGSFPAPQGIAQWMANVVEDPVQLKDPACAQPIPGLTRKTSDLIANWMHVNSSAEASADTTKAKPRPKSPPKPKPSPKPKPKPSPPLELKKTTSELVAKEWGVSKAEARRRLNKMAEVHALMVTQEAAGQAGEAADPYVGKNVVMVRGKYNGRKAFVQRKVKKKWRLQVEGVDWGLEFYDNMFKVA